MVTQAHRNLEHEHRWSLSGLLALVILCGCSGNPASAPRGQDDDETAAEQLVVRLGGTAIRNDDEPGKPVREVLLNHHKVTDEHLKELKVLKRLTRLFLGDTQVTDAGLKELKELKQLKELHLQNTNVTDAGLTELRELKQLQLLNLSGTKVTAAGVQGLLEALPDCRISADVPVRKK